jgi:hypothetical protein
MDDILRIAAMQYGLAPDEVVEAHRSAMDELPSVESLHQIEGLLWNAFREASLVLGGPFPHAQLIAWTWLAQAVRHSHAAFHLEASGLADTAAVHARAAVEHGVYLSLLATAEDPNTVLDRLEHEYARTVNLALDTSDADIQVPGIFALLIGDLGDTAKPEGTDWVSHFQQVCGRLRTGGLIYTHYRGLSTQSHPGFGTAAPYIVGGFPGVAKGAPIGLVHDPQVVDVQITLWLSVGASCWAGWSADQIFGVDHFGPVLSQFAPRLGFSRLDRV